MKTIVSFLAEARKIVERTHLVYPFAEGMKGAFTVLEGQTVAYPAGTDTPELILGVVPDAESQQNWACVKASLTSVTLMAGSTTLGVTFTFGYVRSIANVAQAFVPIATYVTNTTPGQDLPADVERQATLLAAAGSMQAGDEVSVRLTHASTGTAVPIGMNARVELQ
jgi:hypothetical protein